MQSGLKSQSRKKVRFAPIAANRGVWIRGQEKSIKIKMYMKDLFAVIWILRFLRIYQRI